MTTKIKFITILLFSILVFLECGSSSDSNELKERSSDISESELNFLASTNKFDFDFLKNLDNSKKKDIYFFPYSLDD